MPTPDNDTQSLLAYDDAVVAIDLGSNSFHLLQARLGPSGLEPLAVMAQKVQLGLGMVDNRLSAEAIARGLACLQDFAVYTRDKPGSMVRVVGTQALRQASNQHDFIALASDVLQHPIEVISGEEEAELAYLGVEAALSSPSRPLLVVDIGGGSTELVAANDGVMDAVATIPVGCVSYLKYFPGGAISEEALKTAQAAAIDQFASISSRFVDKWQLAVGCSGTLLAVGQVLLQQGWLCSKHHNAKHCHAESLLSISRAGLEALRAALLTFDSIDAIRFQGLSEDRRSIFASGIAIVLALFDSFAIDTMQLSLAGLREGVAWNLLHVQ